jgi:glycerol dehydrogenase
MNDHMLKAVFPGKYIQQENALELLPELIQLFGQRGMILASPSAIKTLSHNPSLMTSGGNTQLEQFRGECSEKELQRVEALVRQQKIDVLVGMGGGKTIDTAKIVSDRTNIPVIIVPTIASTDAPCSGCAVIYTDQGEFESVYYQKMNPQVVLVDMRIMADAPTRFLVAGMGDALATWFEARSCTGSHSVNACGGHSTMAALTLARLCYDILLADGVAAKADNALHLVTPALHRVVEANTLLSGIGFESAGLASAHSVHNGLTALEETHAFYHGEKVAFGVVTGLHLNQASVGEMETVYGFCESVGLPTTFADVGLINPYREQLMKAAIKACAPEECIHHEAFKVTPALVLDAMMAANAMGQRRNALR